MLAMAAAAACTAAGAGANDGSDVAVKVTTAAVAEMPVEELLEDYGELSLEEELAAAPVIRFGRAVDLLGRDIEPVPKSLPGKIIGGMPAGLPMSGARLTSNFGMRYHPTLGGSRFHAGVDLAAPHGAPVTATAAGQVSRAGWAGGYGILVSIAHGGSVETRYAHLSALAVRPGQAVSKGQIIGYVGSTGRSTGPHLHYETRVSGQPTNPFGYR
jgi:murein DD-endopeptidase MepM/ murein hydrolase activator NlpD